MIKKIVINSPLLDLNKYVNGQRHNRYAGNNQKRAQTRLCAIYIGKHMQGGLRLDTSELPADFKFKWYVKNKRKDKDNIAFGKKFIFDAMVETGLLENDGWQQVGNFSDEFYIDENERVEIEIITK